MQKENFVNLLNRLNIKFEERDVVKNNGVVLHGFVLDTGKDVRPTVYLDNLDTKNEVEWAHFLFGLLERAEKGTDFTIEEIFKPSYLMENLFVGVRNIAMNVNDTDTLTRVVEEFEDLEKFLFIRVDQKVAFELGMTEGFGTLKIKEGMLDMIGMSENTLFDIAETNTMNDLQFRGLIETLMGMLPFDANEEPIGIDRVPERMYVCNFRNNTVYGAGAIANFKELKKRIEKELGFKRFYVIPSSIHEILIVNSEELSREELSKMVQQVNAEAVNDNEVLSNHAYGIFTI